MYDLTRSICLSRGGSQWSVSAWLVGKVRQLLAITITAESVSAVLGVLSQRSTLSSVRACGVQLLQRCAMVVAAERLDQIAVRLGVAEVERGHDGVGDNTDDEYQHDDDQHHGYAPAHVAGYA